MSYYNTIVGIARPDNAKYVSSWPGYHVKTGDYVLVAFESLDEDFIFRTVGPLTIRSADGYVDLINGPKNYKICTGYDCAERPAIFYAVCAVGMCKIMDTFNAWFTFMLNF